MTFLDKFPKDPSPEEILSQLQRFLGQNSSQQQTASTSSSKGIKGKIKKAAVSEELSMKDLTHLGLWLIRHLPVARDSVFEFISRTYDQFIKEYIIQQQGNSSSCTEDDLKLLDDIHEAFITFLEDNGEIWSPILSTWTLHLLGELSKDYSHQITFIIGAAQLQNVNETTRFWMGSKAIQSLMDLTARCLTCRDHANADSFISALIDTSTIHSPRFDWVVAHVGNTYPQTIVTQVLNLGFQNFSTNSPMASVKLNSVRAILEHLVGAHSKEVQSAFDQTIQQGLTDSNSKMLILYVMSMCSNSMPLLDVLMDTILPRVNEETLLKIRSIVPKWIQVHFGGGDVTAVVALVTHLIMKSSRGPKALEILMQGCKLWSNPIGLYARTLLDHFIAEASNMFYESDSPRKGLATNFPAFPAMKDNASLVINFLNDSDNQLCRASKQFIKILSMYDGAAVGVKAVCHYLRESTEDKHLWHMIDLVAMLEMKYPNLMSSSLQILAIKINSKEVGDSNKKTERKLRKWNNILKILKSEKDKPKMAMKYSMSRVLQENISVLTPLIDVRKTGFEMEEASLIVEILAKLPNLTTNSRFGTCLTLQRHLVEYFFKVLATTSLNHTSKVKNVANITKLLHQLAEDSAIQNDALRSLVQFSLYPECKQLFMKRVIGNPKLNYSAFDFDCVDTYNNDNEFQPEKFSMYASLMEENQKRSAVLNIPGSHATTFHSGRLLKNGMKNWSALKKVLIIENEDAYLNFELFLSVLQNVCMSVPAIGSEYFNTISPSDKGKVVSVEAMRKVALLLVEIVSPDVMFNGLPWPEEEFSRVQVERDLQIKRAFEDHPYLWDLLELVANHCPSLCYCSVLIRAVMATLMSHWVSCQESPTKNSPNQLESTIRLFQIMKTGQLVPPPLCFIGQVVHELKAHETLGLLKDVWAYMKMNVPATTIFIIDPSSNKYVRSPEFSVADETYTEKLRLAILNNIERLGYLFPKLFPVKSPKPTTVET